MAGSIAVPAYPVGVPLTATGAVGPAIQGSVPVLYPPNTRNLSVPGLAAPAPGMGFALKAGLPNTGNPPRMTAYAPSQFAQIPIATTQGLSYQPTTYQRYIGAPTGF